MHVSGLFFKIYNAFPKKFREAEIPASFRMVLST